MSIKERMEKGQKWNGGSGSSYKITGSGDDNTLCRRILRDGALCIEIRIHYARCEEDNWTLTHEADGSPACEFCVDKNQCEALPEGAGWDALWTCNREKGHPGDHVACGIRHARHHWPQEQDKPPVVRKVDIEHFGVLTQHQRDITLADAMSRGDYMGWQDDRGNLRGVFRRKDGSPAVSQCLTVEQWESGEWEVVKPQKVWFEGGWQ